MKCENIESLAVSEFVLGLSSTEYDLHERTVLVNLTKYQLEMARLI